MKRCPTCNRAYSDNSLIYCLEDGSPLFGTTDPEATLVIPKTTDAVLQPRTTIPSHPSQSPLRWVLVAALVLLALLLGGAAVAFVYELNKRESPTSRTRPPETPTPVPAEKSVKPETDKPPPPQSSPPVDNQVQPKSLNTRDLSGEWNLVNTIEKTSYPSFVNLQIGYRLVINQTGTEFTAEGEKISENGKPLAPSQRTPLHVTGSVDGAAVGATFVEEGVRRKTSGRFVWRIDAEGTQLSGTFVSTAASASGISVATKER